MTTPVYYLCFWRLCCLPVLFHKGVEAALLYSVRSFVLALGLWWNVIFAYFLRYIIVILKRTMLYIMVSIEHYEKNEGAGRPKWEIRGVNANSVYPLSI